MNNETNQDSSAGFGTGEVPKFERDAKRFASAISEWSAAVQREIASRENAEADYPGIDEYNQRIVFGLKLAHSMMLDALHHQLTQ